MIYNRKAFTLIEVMIATAVLAFGIILIFEAFFTTINSHDTYERYLAVLPWMHEKLWLAQDSLMQNGETAEADGRGEITLDGRIFNWILEHRIEDSETGLHRIDLEVAWQQGRRRPRLMRTAYVFERKPEQESEDE